MFKKDIEKVVCEYLGIDFEEREQWLKRREELQQLKIKLEHKVLVTVIAVKSSNNTIHRAGNKPTVVKDLLVNNL